MQPTREGEAVVIHDATLDRTTDGTGRVADRTLAELRTLDAGHRFTPDGGRSFPYRGQGVSISTLSELLAAFPGARVNVEIKDARAQEAAWRAVHDAGAVHRVLIAAGRSADRARFRDYAGPISASGGELRAFYVAHRLHLSRALRLRVDALQLPERHAGRRVVSRRLVADAHARNVAVHVWTVDEPADMRRLFDWGVDGIVTDRPDRLAQVLHDRFARPLPPGPPAGESPPFLERLLRP